MTIDRETKAQLDKLEEMIRLHQGKIDEHQQNINNLEIELFQLEIEANVYHLANLGGMADDLAQKIEAVETKIAALKRTDLRITSAIVKAAEKIKSTIEKELHEQELYDLKQKL